MTASFETAAFTGTGRFDMLMVAPFVSFKLPTPTTGVRQNRNVAPSTGPDWRTLNSTPSSS